MTTRSIRGLRLEAALRAYSPPAAIEELDRIGRPPNVAFAPMLSEPDPGSPQGWADAYFSRREVLEAALRDKLIRGDLVATAFAVPVTLASQREIIAPHLWDVLEPNFDESSASGGRLTLAEVEILDPDCSAMVRPSALPDVIPIHDGPLALERPGPRVPISLSDDDRILTIADQRFFLRGEIQQTIMRQLCATLESGNPVRTRDVLDYAGSNVDTFAKAFSGSPHWDALKPYLKQKDGWCWLET
jgi:hypothetical protein